MLFSRQTIQSSHPEPVVGWFLPENLALEQPARMEFEPQYRQLALALIPKVSLCKGGISFFDNSGVLRGMFLRVDTLSPSQVFI